MFGVQLPCLRLLILSGPYDQSTAAKEHDISNLRLEALVCWQGVGSLLKRISRLHMLNFLLLLGAQKRCSNLQLWNRTPSERFRGWSHRCGVGLASDQQ